MKRTLAQPKYDNRVELDEVTEAQPERLPAAASPINHAPQKSDWRRTASQPSFVAGAEVSADREAVRARPPISPAVVADRESVSEEREVFEL